MRHKQLTAVVGSVGMLTVGNVYEVLAQDEDYYNTYLVKGDSGIECYYSHTYFKETCMDNPVVTNINGVTYVDYSLVEMKYREKENIK